MKTCTGFSGALQLVIVAWVFVAPAAFSQIRGCDPRDRICLEAMRGLVTTSETAEEQLYWATQSEGLETAVGVAMNPFARGMVGHDDREWRDLLKNKLQANLIDRGVESASVYSLYEYVSRDE